MGARTASTMSSGSRRMKKRGGVEMNLTEAEAVSVLQNHINTYYEQMSESELNSYQMAINALEKQIPVKPVKSKEERYGMGYVYHDWICPSCGRFLAPEPTQTGNHRCYSCWSVAK